MTQEVIEPPVSVANQSTFDRWIYRLWKRITADGQIAWDQIVLGGADLVDLGTRNHADLQNINTASYTHLTSTQATDLTDAGDSTLHYHAADRVLANITGLPTGEEILTVPTTPLTVTGSRSDGTALASLLTHLATLGIITDSSTT